jgi:hypothetical protein
VAATKSKKFDFMGGGLVTRPDDHWIDLISKGHLFSPELSNVTFNKTASIQKTLGYTQVGADVQGANTSIFMSWTGGGPGIQVTAQNNNTIVICQKFTASSTSTIEAYKFLLNSARTNPFQITNGICKIKSDSAGNPGTTLATSANTYIDGYELPLDLTSFIYFYFPTPLAVTNGTAYWVCFEMTTGASAAAITQTINTIPTASVGDVVKYGNNGYTGLTTVADIALIGTLYTGSRPVLGIYDYRVDSGGSITQIPIAAVNGSLYEYVASTWTSIKSGLASNVNSLYDFATLKNYLFSCDFATSANQAWDGAAASTMTHGYRGTFTIGQSASAGGPWSAAGIVKVMLVTELLSGGYRASEVKSVTLGATTNKIDLTAIAVDATAAEFSFDIAALATTIYCTLPNGEIFYKVPPAFVSAGGINPIANNDTAESILPMTNAQLIAGGTIESLLGYPQGYFTGQVDTPKAKYLEVFQDMLVMAGDPNNLNRVWFSEQFAPQVWGNGQSGSGLEGDFLDIATDDGEIITGLALTDGALIVAKQHRMYRVTFTGNAQDTWFVQLIHGQVGVLSNWTMQVIPEGLFFLSDRGPAICYGTYSDVLPQTRLIQNLFSNSDAASFELASMARSVACNDTTRNQILMTVSSPDSTVRDRILSYDYEQRMFSLQDGAQANYVAIVGDSNGFPVFWQGNLSGQVFSESTNWSANGFPIPMRFTTPFMDMSGPDMTKQINWLWVAGVSQTDFASPLVIDVYVNDSETVSWSIVMNTTHADFVSGLAARIGTVCRSVRFRFRNLSYNLNGAPGRGCELHWMRLEYSDAGGTRL